MATQIDHPVLGVITGDKGEWQVQREIPLPCTGYSIRDAIIGVADLLGEPTPQQLQALVDLMRTPVAFRADIARAIFRAYVDEIRPLYFEMLSDTRHTYAGVTLADLPEVQTPDDVWKLVTGLYGVWVRQDATINVEYSVTFDTGHELHVLLDGGQIEHVWME